MRGQHDIAIEFNIIARLIIDNKSGVLIKNISNCPQAVCFETDDCKLLCRRWRCTKQELDRGDMSAIFVNFLKLYKARIPGFIEWAVKSNARRPSSILNPWALLLTHNADNSDASNASKYEVEIGTDVSMTFSLSFSSGSATGDTVGINTGIFRGTCD